MTGAGLEKFSNPTWSEHQPKNPLPPPQQFELDFRL